MPNDQTCSLSSSLPTHAPAQPIVVPPSSVSTTFICFVRLEVASFRQSNEYPDGNGRDDKRTKYGL